MIHGDVIVERVGLIVIGSGVAGLSTALGLRACTLVTAAGLGFGGSTPLAQGGVAAAIDARDRPADHAADTIAVAGGLAVHEVVDLVVNGGPEAIDELVRLGAGFDRDVDGGLQLGREAGHSARRIVHANGDATGAEVASVLERAVASTTAIDVRERTTVVDLVLDSAVNGGSVVGVLVDAEGERRVLLGSAVVLATGGYAHCFARTTTPRGAIGSAVALASRVGAQLADLEFVQFHPTALNVSGDERLPLLTEALRGEGAQLLDDAGDRFMLGVHDDAELAPRDVVARATYQQLMDGRSPVLDSRLSLGEDIQSRFPTVFGLAQQHGLDPRTEVLPITPAAHFCMGGVAVDDEGRSSVPGLWAVGEAASTGLHGANRLASNSLLEGLVLGRRTAVAIREDGRKLSPSIVPGEPGMFAVPVSEPSMTVGVPDAEAQAVIAALRDILWTRVGVVRTAIGLHDALDRLRELESSAQHNLVARTIHTVAVLVADAALARTESRGAHFRRDYPTSDPQQAQRSLTYNKPSSRCFFLERPSPTIRCESSMCSIRMSSSSPGASKC